MMSRKPDRLPLVVIGCDFRVASSSWRGKMLLGPKERLDLYSMLARLDREAGIVFLVTCNRSEWVVSASEPEWLGNLLLAHVDYLWEELSRSKRYLPAAYVYTGHAAASHAFRVASGLESFVMGEQQIARQFHAAAQKAREEGTSTAILNGLDNLAGRLSKRLRELGLLRTQSMGIHSAAARYIGRNFPAPSGGDKGVVAVVGMGQVGKKIAALLEESGGWKVVRINRTVRSACWVPLGRLGEILRSADGVVFCTGSDKPVSKLSQLARWKNRRKNLWVVDIGVPAQVELDRPESRSITVAGLDRLVQEPADRMQRDWMRSVEAQVGSAVKDFEILCRERSMVNFLCGSQALHRNYIKTVIPSLVENGFAHLPPGDRKKLLSRIRKLLIDYSSSLLDNFHSAHG